MEGNAGARGTKKIQRNRRAKESKLFQKYVRRATVLRRNSTQFKKGKQLEAHRNKHLESGSAVRGIQKLRQAGHHRCFKKGRSKFKKNANMACDWQRVPGTEKERTPCAPIRNKKHHLFQQKLVHREIASNKQTSNKHFTSVTMAATAAETSTMAAKPSIAIYRHDVITAFPVTVSQASTHCVMTLGKSAPTKEDVHDAFTTLTGLQRNITGLGEVELKSYVLKAAAEKGIKHAGNPVSSWNALTSEWRDNPKMLLCKDIYEIMVSEFNQKGDWYTEKEKLIRHKLNFKFVEDSHQNGDSFVVLILKKCHSNIWKTFGAGRKMAHKVGLTQKREKGHPMGAPPKKTKAEVFCFQNVSGWEELCAKDPMANALYQKKKQAGDGFFEQDVAKAILLMDDSDDESIGDPRHGGSNRAPRLTETSAPKSASTPAASPPALVTANDPSSLLTKTDSRLRQEGSPNGVTVSYASTASSPTVRKSTVTAQESSNNTDIVRASSLVQVDMAEGQVGTNNFDDLSTMKQSCITEVIKGGGHACVQKAV